MQLIQVTARGFEELCDQMSKVDIDYWLERKGTSPGEKYWVLMVEGGECGKIRLYESALPVFAIDIRALADNGFNQSVMPE